MRPPIARRPHRAASRLLMLAGLLASGLLAPRALYAGSSIRGASAVAPHYAGWAMDAYPGDSEASLESQMRRQVRAGANVVWLGHNNPGEVGYGKNEPGLSYAVWAAFRDNNAKQHGEAIGMVQAVERALDAARAVGVRVILPVGYQIQMGAAWNLAHPTDLRLGSDSGVYGPGKGGISASFYAPRYRTDIVTYYKWVEATFVHPYAATILMLNLADEPADGDYSNWADQAFRAQSGYGLRQAGSDLARQLAVGRFESEYIANYAAWSANQWQSIDPAIKVTLSFDGGYSRYIHQGPNLEAIFRASPANFVVTFDAYPRDGLYNTALRESDLIALFALIRTLGHYSAAYNRTLWLWSAANSWGLNGASNDPGNIADAVANGIYLAQLVNQAGGTLLGIAAWNYNIRTQGLYNDTHHLTYAPDAMFARVSASFPLLRQIMAAPPGSPDAVVLAPDAPVLRQAGANLPLRAAELYHWSALAALARNNVDAPVVNTLAGAALPAMRTALVLARAPTDLTADDMTALRAILAGDGTIVAGSAVAALLAPAGAASQLLAAGGTPEIRVRRLATAHGILLAVDGAVVEDIFADSKAAWATSLWAQLFHRPIQNGGYLLAAGGVTLLYGAVVGDGASMSLPVGPSAAQSHLTLYGINGQPRQTIGLAGRGGTLRVFVPRRSYGLILAAPTPPPSAG